MTDGTKISFSLGGPSATTGSKNEGGMSNMEKLLAQAKAKQPTASQTKPKPKAPIFDDDDDDIAASHAPPSLLAGPSKPRIQTKQTSSMSRIERKAHAEALAIDASVFDYDGVYDGMKAVERQREEKKKAEDADKKPKYMDAFRASAQTRKLDKLRAEEKMLQLEREKEGGEFDDKEKFVTEAYKRQMEEVRKAEEEEKAREEALRKSNKGPGMTEWHKQRMEEEEARHAAAVAATSAPKQGPSLAIRPPTQPTYEAEAEYDPMLAREAKNQAKEAGASKPLGSNGQAVEVNDDGEVVDHRTLLKAGLNIMKKPNTALPNSLLAGQRSNTTSDGPYKSRAVGAAAGYQERMERERKRLADQMREEQERKKAAEEARIREEEELARRRREGDDGEAQRKREEAKQKYLERKRQREEAEKAGNKRAKEE